ncbi:MAG: hypothetical protein U0894_01315 [Pirellulales bacterium]
MRSRRTYLGVVAIVAIAISFLVWRKNANDREIAIAAANDKAITSKALSSIENGESLSILLLGNYNPPLKPGEWRKLQLTDGLKKEMKDCLELSPNIQLEDPEKRYFLSTGFRIIAKVSGSKEETFTMVICSTNPDAIMGSPLTFGDKDQYNSRLLTPCMEKLLLRVWPEGTVIDE